MAHKITVDRDKCVACEACTRTCSASFAMKDGKAAPVKPEVEELTCEKAAESGCPVGAISVS
jgi:ferredoxin